MFEKIKINFKSIKKIVPTMTFVFLLAFPASTNYKLKDFGFGSGGVGNATAGSYAMDAITGEQSGAPGANGGYKMVPGLLFTNQANVPIAPAFNNPNNYYNKLQIILDTSGNPSDTKFAIAISTDNFVTTNYIQNDDTIGAVLGSEDYQTNVLWGASGFYVIGLAPGTTYKVKVKAMQGKFTETGYGPIATQATVSPTMSFNININTINFGSLTAGSVANSPNVVVDFTTNGASGGKVYVIGQNGGLLSLSKSHIITSATTDLANPAEGFGAQGTLATQSSGGPLSIVAPYNVATTNVGIVNSSVREIFSSSNPIVGGQGTFILKAKSVALTQAANDYSELLTVIASGSF